MSEYGNMPVILKLVSSETIICQVVSDTDKNMIIRDPYLVTTISEKMGDGIRSSTYYSDWFLGAASRIHMIRKDHVMSASIPDDAVKADYATLIEVRDEKKDTATPSKQDQSWQDDLNYKIKNDGDVSRN